jgi:hypothetical protein
MMKGGEQMETIALVLVIALAVIGIAKVKAGTL